MDRLTRVFCFLVLLLLLLSSTKFTEQKKNKNQCPYHHHHHLNGEFVDRSDHYENVSSVFTACREALKITEWKCTFVADFRNPVTFLLPETFTHSLYREIGPIVLTDQEWTSPMNSKVVLLMSGVGNLLRLIKAPIPLWSADIFYVILLSRLPEDGCLKIFKRLWNNWYILNVVILTTDHTDRTITYNPFTDTIEQQQQPSSKQFKTTIRRNYTTGGMMVNNVRRIMKRKMTDLRGYPVRIVMFPTRLKAVRRKDGTYEGTDGVILSALAKHMNFTPVIREPSDGSKYGWKTEKGAFTGSIGDVVYKRTSIAFNSIFIKDYQTDAVQFTTPVQFDQVCFVVPKALAKSQWKAVFQCFDSEIWISLLAVYIFISAVWRLLKKLLALSSVFTGNDDVSTTNLGRQFSGGHQSESTVDTQIVALNVYRMFLLSPVNRLPRSTSERFLVGAVLILSFVVASSFQGSLVKFLSYRTYDQDIRTIRQLLKDTDYRILSASLNLKEIFETDDDNPYMTALADRFSLVRKHTDILGQIAFKRNAAAIGRKEDIQEKIAASYIKDNHRILLHIVQECPRSYHIAYLMPKKSPFTNAFNDIINTFVEAGIINSWFMHSKPFRPLSDYHSVVKEPHVVFTMENMIIAFLVLIAGYLISFIVFVVELSWHSYYYRSPTRSNLTVRPRKRDIIRPKFVIPNR